MEEISNGVVLLAQQLCLDTDSENTDQPAENLAEELVSEDLMELEAERTAEKQDREKEKNLQPEQQRYRDLQKILKFKAGKLFLSLPRRHAGRVAV